MTLEEAKKQARQLLIDYKTNLAALHSRRARLECKRAELGLIQEQGSCKGMEYTEPAGKASAKYVDSVPSWIQRVEQLFAEIKKLELGIMRAECDVNPITQLLAHLQEEKSPMWIVYHLRYEKKLKSREAEDVAKLEHGLPEPTFWKANKALINRVIRYSNIEYDSANEAEIY